MARPASQWADSLRVQSKNRLKNANFFPSGMLQTIWPAVKPESPLAHSHRGKAVQVPKVQQRLHPAGTFAKARFGAYRGEAAPV